MIFLFNIIYSLSSSQENLTTKVPKTVKWTTTTLFMLHCAPFWRSHRLLLVSLAPTVQTTSRVRLLLCCCSYFLQYKKVVTLKLKSSGLSQQSLNINHPSHLLKSSCIIEIVKTTFKLNLIKFCFLLVNLRISSNHFELPWVIWPKYIVYSLWIHTLWIFWNNFQRNISLKSISFTFVNLFFFQKKWITFTENLLNKEKKVLLKTDQWHLM